VIHFLFDFYESFYETKVPHYLVLYQTCIARVPGQKNYWEYIDYICHYGCDKDKETVTEKRHFGRLSIKKATKAYRVYRILLKAFKNKGGKRYLVTSHNLQARLKSISCDGIKTTRSIFNTCKLLISTF
jgi:hypothetical protein